MSDSNGAANGANEPTAAPSPEPTLEAAERAIEAEMARLSAEAMDFKDKLLRTLADMENLRRRTEREVKDARDYALTSFARDLLSVTDNFERALGAAPAELKENETAKAFIDGVDLTGRELAKVLEKHGIRKVEPHGQKFDPNLHQAMFEIPNTEVPNGTVLQVLQAGFTIADRVLRPALVGVSKGGPKVVAEAAGVDKTV
jgi:molecular chaperone GrpE